ncbi:MAG TPA: DUF58 domain-containing protein, partial [Solibacterales bacterium]|nr:DUF58 domain-containing protein [Bryobacterales bacterium]
GDDLRHVDWNVFARTERCYLKRYRGETNTLVTVLLDASASMAFTSHAVTKLNYARFMASSLLYLANRQRDATGVVVFDDEVRQIVRPSSRQGQLARLTHAIEHAEPGQRTDFQKPFLLCQELLKRRGIIIVISDFWAHPELVVKTMQPLRYHGNELVLVHVLDPQELRPQLNEPRILLDMETGDSLEVSPEYVANEYRPKIDAHVEALRKEARGSGIDYFLTRTDRPLDECLREYLTVRQGRM